MKIYQIYRTDDYGYDEYDGAVVIAKSPQDAIKIHPGGATHEDPDLWDSSWVAPKNIKVEYIGKAAANVKRGVVLASFNAG
ncbi:MAG: hypothetical protein JRG69_06285 [Deltaproteobacteria bacterium]|nr:hypothetical protein [Deltaproteobacteria bacterium]